MITKLADIPVVKAPTHKHKKTGQQFAAVRAPEDFAIVLPPRPWRNEKTGETGVGDGGRIDGRKGDWILRHGECVFCEPDVDPKDNRTPHFAALYETL